MEQFQQATGVCWYSVLDSRIDVLSKKDFTHPQILLFVILLTNFLLSHYKQPLLYVVFLSEILCICNPEMASFLEPIFWFMVILGLFYANLLYASLFFKSLSLAYNEAQLYFLKIFH